MSITEIFEEIRALSPEERRELMNLMVDTLTEDTAQQKKHSIMELAGLGAEIWEGIDAQEYVRQLRSEWDHRS